MTFASVTNRSAVAGNICNCATCFPLLKSQTSHTLPKICIKPQESQNEPVKSENHLLCDLPDDVLKIIYHFLKEMVTIEQPYKLGPCYDYNLPYKVLKREQWRRQKLCIFMASKEGIAYYDSGVKICGQQQMRCIYCYKATLERVVCFKCDSVFCEQMYG